MAANIGLPELCNHPKLAFLTPAPRPSYKPQQGARLGWSARLFVGLWKLYPEMRKVGRLLRYRF
ncbi:MAG: hypothetical protein E5V86_10485 [Mesorhizobium sp.]|nr:MAG: hypothetical protein E5V86_10485 [Mesorhizobium sp.]